MIKNSSIIAFILLPYFTFFLISSDILRLLFQQWAVQFYSKYNYLPNMHSRIINIFLSLIMTVSSSSQVNNFFLFHFFSFNSQKKCYFAQYPWIRRPQNERIKMIINLPLQADNIYIKIFLISNYDQQQNIMESEQQDIHHYFATKIKPLFSELMYNLVKFKPQDIIDYSLKHFRDKKISENAYYNQNSDSEDQYYHQHSYHRFQVISDEQFIQKRTQKLKKARYKRTGLSSQAYGVHGNRKSIAIPRGFNKNQDAHCNILFFCMNSFLFRHFTESEIDYLIKIMSERKTSENQIVFQEGQQGDLIYFVYEGIYECYRENEKGEKIIRYYHKGDTFGQICLMHVIKRQASIRSQNNGILYTLNRQSYIHYKKMCINKRRALYMYTLKAQTLFQSFDEEQLEKICDVLKEVTYQEGEIVINEGDVGERFYIIIEGILVAYQGKQENIIQCFKQGNAFGQIALIKQIPRQASIKTLTRCRLVYLSKSMFTRIFQNVNLNKQIEEKYGKHNTFLMKRQQ